MPITVVIPVYNEVGAIGRVLAEMPSALVDRVLVIDGGSTDGTQEAARAMGATVLPQRGRGYGAACLSGAWAAEDGLLVFLDGDYSDPPQQIERVLAPLRASAADLVLGSREHGQMAVEEVRMRRADERLPELTTPWLILVPPRPGEEPAVADVLNASFDALRPWLAFAQAPTIGAQPTARSITGSPGGSVPNVGCRVVS